MIAIQSVLGHQCWMVESWRERGVAHGFLGRSLDAVNELHGSSFGPGDGEPLLLLRQVHGQTVVEVTAAQSLERYRSERPEGDAWVAAPGGGGGVLGIRTADCAPVLLVDLSTGVVSAVHAGWRGTIGGVLHAALEALLRNGAAPMNIEMAIGPAAQRCCYEVGEEVVEALLRNTSENLQPRRFIEGGRGRQTLDIPALLRAQGEAWGVSVKNIFHSDRCTICDERFFSYRREKAHAGRQLSFVRTL